MPCYHPISAVVQGTTPNGKQNIAFSRKTHLYPKHKQLQLPCGQCIGCRLERSRQWAVRVIHEASTCEHNCFITLTFNDENLNPNLSLDKPKGSRFQKFMKRLRKKYHPKPIRFIHCGEYGEKLDRPHHHACLFNHDFKDKELLRENQGVKLYTSETLQKLWPYGYSTIGDVTFDSASYVARYITKKINGALAKDHYKGKIAEYITMSRRPGLGKAWYDQYKDTDVYNRDEIIIRDNIKCKPPKYYDSLYELDNPEKIITIKDIRKAKAQRSLDNTQARLNIREQVKLSKFKQLKRSYENETSSI